MNELKIIPGFPDYSITRDGRVWSYHRSGRWLVPQVANVSGHLFVRLSSDGRKTKHYLHRVVWETFNGPIPSDREIDHIDRNAANNHISNLRLASHSENLLNTGLRSDNTSGFKGVYQLKPRARLGQRSWFGRVKSQGVCHYTRYFDTPEEANQVVKELRERLCGEFAYHE